MPLTLRTVCSRFEPGGHRVGGELHRGIRMSKPTNPRTLLLAANYDSGVGYAWWLMESYWVRLAQAYASSHRVALAYPSISKLPAAVASAPLRPVVSDFSLTDPVSVLRQAKFVFAEKVKTIYFTDQSVLHWRYLVLRVAGVRTIVVHDHTPGVRAKPAGLKRLLKRILYRLPWITSDAVIGATEFVRSRHIDTTCMPVRKCFVAPNGLPAAAAFVAADPRAAFGIPDTRKIVVITGRAHRVKGLDFALRCMVRITRELGHKDVHLLHLGGGPQLEELRELAVRLGVREYVTLAGHQDSVRPLLGGCDLAFHPSQAEVGYSLSILEYMQAGLPVVVPDNPSVCEATAHLRTGLHYAEGNLTAASDAIVSLIESDELRARLGQGARQAVAERFTLGEAHAGLVRCFREVDPFFPADGRSTS
jgi:glycosyltransferase involved in cell wall biosynthesis